MSDLECLGTRLGELDAELPRLTGAERDSDEQNSAVDAAADAEFRLRGRSKVCHTSKKASNLAASTDPLGIRVEGISALHSKRIRQLVRNQGWVHIDETAIFAALNDDQLSRYRAVAGRGAASTFRDAREYLAAATGLT